ncbi:LOW QUALITY PROTEIN: protein FAM110B-like [Gymnodraco acuticeps]|uniref:LOW QUALITY PROTEIN: protein FAM110B-like n=1 Tax=Gymnodraco acuticeps TaxID=8218 RepID=A0A6P8W0S1_GYMAC|nr:LOW QUALITY PROTEIN: protein FAM110B-like [Gymnodraco acuticeps]
MPLETLQQQPKRTALAGTPPRLRPKGPVGPDFYRQLRAVAAAGGPRQSAVERLEADKAKYVKSQGALSKQQPLEERKGPLEVLELRNGPLEMKKGPLEVRKGPLEIKNGPLGLRKGPLVLRKGPLELRKGPLEVKNGPLEVRKGPLEMKNGPLEVRNGPLEVRNGPLEVRNGPLEVRNGPLEVRKGPLEMKNGPLEVRNGPLEVRKGPLMSSAVMRPTRKTNTKPGGPQLDLQHLSNLISVSEGGAHCEERAPAETADSTQQGPQKECPCPPPRPDWSSPAKIRLKTLVSTLMEDPGSPPAAGTVRRVDVLPPACRPPHYMLQPLQPLPLQPQSPLHPGPSHLRLFHTRTTPRASPLKPVVAAYKPECPAGKNPSSSFPISLPAVPPPSLSLSPAVTLLSSSSSRKRRSLARSKSDLSDRCSMERFFNLCGVDPSDLQLAGSCSDIVSLARFRSVSAPGSECAGEEEEEVEEEEEEAGNAAARVPYGISVIEKNARVIKWLYGLRQAIDTKSTNL